MTWSIQLHSNKSCAIDVYFMRVYNYSQCPQAKWNKTCHYVGWLDSCSKRLTAPHLSNYRRYFTSNTVAWIQICSNLLHIMICQTPQSRTNHQKNPTQIKKHAFFDEEILQRNNTTETLEGSIHVTCVPKVGKTARYILPLACGQTLWFFIGVSRILPLITISKS